MSTNKELVVRKRVERGRMRGAKAVEAEELERVERLLDETANALAFVKIAESDGANHDAFVRAKSMVEKAHVAVYCLMRFSIPLHGESSPTREGTDREKNTAEG